MLRWKGFCCGPLREGAAWGTDGPRWQTDQGGSGGGRGAAYGERAPRAWAPVKSKKRPRIDDGGGAELLGDLLAETRAFARNVDEASAAARIHDVLVRRDAELEALLMKETMMKATCRRTVNS